MTCEDCIHYDVCKAPEDQLSMIDARQSERLKQEKERVTYARLDLKEEVQL